MRTFSELFPFFESSHKQTRKCTLLEKRALPTEFHLVLYSSIKKKGVPLKHFCVMTLICLLFIICRNLLHTNVSSQTVPVTQLLFWYQAQGSPTFTTATSKIINNEQGSKIE